MCSEPATTREHVPPRCFFPKQKDFNDGKNYRDEPMVVPSCHEHNTEKSKDDEYTFMMMLIYFKNNPTAKKLFETKVVQRMLKKRPHLVNLYKIGPSPGAIQPDVSRLQKSWEQIARALYFHHFGDKWLSTEIHILSHSLSLLPEDSDDVFKAQRKILANEKILQVTSEASKAPEASDEMKKRYGKHEEIFYYQVARQNESVFLKIEVFAVT